MQFQCKAHFASTNFCDLYAEMVQGRLILMFVVHIVMFASTPYMTTIVRVPLAHAYKPTVWKAEDLNEQNMPKPYNYDLCWRIVWISLSQNLSSSEISRLLSISERTVRRYLSLFRQTGDVQPMSRRNGPKKLLGDFEQLALLRLILEYTSKNYKMSFLNSLESSSVYLPYAEHWGLWAVQDKRCIT